MPINDCHHYNWVLWPTFTNPPEEDFERLVTWADNNALFYGTFDLADQARQRRGEVIEGPAVN